MRLDSQIIPKDLPSSTKIIDIFDKLGKSFLILGNPGSGKTTILLQLTEKLLDRVYSDDRLQIPVVFHLSAWAIARLPFEDWLIGELLLRYGVSKELGKTWVKENTILLLLDGLDEVASEHRESCVNAINQFREKHGLMPIVICSRIEEYDALNVRLSLPTAILVKPLSRIQIEEYLKKFGKSMEGVQAVLQDDEVLWELLEAPFMLNIVTLAFKDKPVESVHGLGNIEERRNQVFDAYKRAMFNRPLRSIITKYAPRKTEHWLSWLAKSMKQNEQSIFYLELMHSEWLPSIWQQRALEIGTFLIAGLIVVLTYRLTNGPAYELIIGLLLGLIAWLAGVMMGAEDEFKAAEDVHFSINDAIGRNTLSGLNVLPLTLELTSALVFGLIGWMVSGLTSGLVLGMVSALAFFLFFGLISGLKGDYLETRKFPNEGLYRSLKNALIVGLFVGLVGGLSSGLVGGRVGGIVDGLIYGLVGGLSVGLSTGLVVGMFCGFYRREGWWFSLKFKLGCSLASIAAEVGLTRGLIGGLIYGLVLGQIGGMAGGVAFGMGIGLAFFFAFGGAKCIEHLLLRLMLYYNNFAPLRYVDFLDFAADRIFLRKVGGGYVFIHRMIMEYFASLEPNPI